MSGITPDRLGPDAVTRSTDADRSGSAALVSRRRKSPANGVWGMALFLCSEITIFGTLLATYFYLESDNRRWPPAGIKPPAVTLPLIATAVLVLSAIPVWLASRSARRGARGAVLGFISLALVLQCGYLAAQVLLFRHDLNQFRPQDTAYGSIYFTLLATHHAHVLVGILLDMVVLAYVSLRGLTNYWLTGVRNLALYWYVVSALAVLVVLAQLSPSL
ncbi:MAG: heme-copper oxidase subunit III [Solirubrobacterales bacterium]|nr:heme-copper oxidase subunit III [Solirubrobacterales bacterium]